MSGSCEHVIELLFSIPHPLRFEKLLLEPEDVESPPARPDVTPEVYRLVRRFTIQTLQDRALPLDFRVNALCRALIDMDENKSGNLAVYRGAWDDAPAADDFTAFCFALGVTGILSEASGNLGPYLEESLHSLRLPPPGTIPDESMLREGFCTFEKARAEFHEKYPDEMRYFEHALVNHVFFTGFPFSDIRENFADESAALAATFLLLRFMCIAFTFGKQGMEPLVDVMAACFRVIEHTAFDYNACRAVIRLENEHGLRLHDAIDRI